MSPEAAQAVRQAPVPPRAVAVSGVMFATLCSASLLLVRLVVPAHPTDAGAWLADPQLRSWLHTALNLIPFTGLAFLWFMGVLRNRIGLLEDRFLATVFLGSGLLFVAMLFTAAAVARGLLDTFGGTNGVPANAQAWQFGRGLTYTLMHTYGFRMAAVFMFVTSMIAIRTRVLARWVAGVGVLAGLILLLVLSDFAWIALIFPAWVLTVSLYILWTDFHPAAAAAGDASD